MTAATFEKASAEFRQHLPDLSTPRFTTAKEQDAYQYSEAFQTKKQPPWIYNLTQVWKTLYQEPFKGVTADGKITIAPTPEIANRSRFCHSESIQTPG
jgi:hypothetical protein